MSTKTVEIPVSTLERLANTLERLEKKLPMTEEEKNNKKFSEVNEGDRNFASWYLLNFHGVEYTVSRISALSSAAQGYKIIPSRVERLNKKNRLYYSRQSLDKDVEYGFKPQEDRIREEIKQSID